MRLILLFLTASLIFAQDNDDAINALTQTIVGLDQSGIEQLNTSLAQENAGLSLTNGNETTTTSSTTQENQTTQQVTSVENNQSTNNTDSVSQTTSVSNTDSTSPSLETSDLVSVDETNSTSVTQETTEEQICLVPYNLGVRVYFFSQNTKAMTLA